MSVHEPDFCAEHAATVARVRRPRSGRPGDGHLVRAALAGALRRRRPHAQYVYLHTYNICTRISRGDYTLTTLDCELKLP